MELHDYIVVGSGCTGAMAAETLIAAGARVLMLDGGQRDTHYASLIPAKDFVTLRATDPAQHRYLLGDDFEGIPDGDVTTGAQLTPPRRFIIDKVARHLPINSSSFFPLESLALGGLGSGWGLGCCVFSAPELRRAGLEAETMGKAYQLIADRIGISGTADDAGAYTAASLRGIQPSIAPDPTAGLMLNRYQLRRASLHRRGFHLGRPSLALLTEQRDERKPTSGRDMDFYSDAERAAYRPWITIDRLRRASLFAYRGNMLVVRFSEASGVVNVETLDLDSGARQTFSCRRLILAAGVLGTARIALRSLAPDARVPLLCNPYCYVPCVVPSRLGGEVPERGTGFAQLSLFHDPNGTQEDVAMASIYSYRQLMLFRLLREVPLNFPDARAIMRYLLPGLLIMGIHHPDAPGAGSALWLEPDPSSPTGDRLVADCRPSRGNDTAIRRRDRAFVGAMRTLGAWGLKRIDPGYGASIHYGGTLPFNQTGARLSLDRSGRLDSSASVFVADGSGFRYLPAKSLTLSLMANAHLVAQRAAVP